MKKIIAITALASLSLPTQAGFWDDLFGSSEPKETAPASAQSTPAPSPSTTNTMVQTGLQLLPMLTQSLGVTGTQATGGMGALLQAAQTLLANTEYATLANAIPGAQSLIAAAPAVTESNEGGLMNQAMSMASSYSPEAKAGSRLVSQFQSLGMSAEMIPKFSEVGADYLQQTGNPEAGALLTSLLPALQ